MDHNEYEANEGAAAFGRHLIFWTSGNVMVYLWLVLQAVLGSCTTFV